MTPAPARVHGPDDRGAYPRLACIADDHTGATDLASGLRRIGIRSVLRFGVPPEGWQPTGSQVVIVGLKVRTVAPDDAVARVRATHHRLATAGITEFYSKYCSTFDSTDRGNIGPISDALLDATGASLAIACPTSPEHARTVHQGHLFVGKRLLSESSMRDHPLTPMTDPDLVAVLGRQTPRDVGLVCHAEVRRGPGAIAAAFEDLVAAGVRHAVVDAATEDDLDAIGAATGPGLLATGGAGLVRGVARARWPATTAPDDGAADLPDGPTLVLSGSCSATTLRQVGAAAGRMPTHRLDPGSVATAAELEERAEHFLRDHGDAPAVLLHASATPEQRRAGAHTFGDETAEVLEVAMGRLARTAVAAGVRRLVVAGGETSGAVIDALGIETLVVTAEVDPGVPWCTTTGDDPLALLLKSGNFGADDVFLRTTGTTA